MHAANYTREWRFYDDVTKWDNPIMIMASRQQFAHRERFISELPFSVMNKVHNILDIGQGWMKLGMCTIFFV